MGAHTTSGLKILFDGNDPFLQSHQIIRVKPRKRKVPEALKTDTSIQKIILRSFPKLEDDVEQRKRAGRWIRVIHLYFKWGYSYAETAEEMGEKPRTVEMLIRAIRRAAENKPCNGTPCRK